MGYRGRLFLFALFLLIEVSQARSRIISKNSIENLSVQDEFDKELTIFLDKIPTYTGNRAELSDMITNIIQNLSNGKLHIVPHNKRQYESGEEEEETGVVGGLESAAGALKNTFEKEFLPTAVNFFKGVQSAVGNLRLNTTGFFQTAQSLVPKAIRPQVAGVFKIINNKVLDQWATTARPNSNSHEITEDLNQKQITEQSIVTTTVGTTKPPRPNKINDFEVEESEEDYSR